MNLEAELSQVTLEGAQAARGSLESLLAEQAGLLNELDSVISWLRGWEPGLGAESFPSPQARLVSAEDRASEWMRAMEASAQTRLPSSVEAIDPRHALPPRRSPWRTLQPRQAFLDVLEKQCANSVLMGFREAQAAHQAIVGEIERAREVVAFSLETAAAGQGYEIAREGVENALLLTSRQRQTALDLVPAVERKLAEAIAMAVEATHHRLEQGRLGVLAQLARQSASDAMRQASALALRSAAQSARRFQTAGNRRYHRVLCNIGWETPPSAVIAPVVTRAYLDQVLNLEQTRRNSR